jgi:hypothetical protein
MVQQRQGWSMPIQFHLSDRRVGNAPLNARATTLRANRTLARRPAGCEDRVKAPAAAMLRMIPTLPATLPNGLPKRSFVRARFQSTSAMPTGCTPRRL